MSDPSRRTSVTRRALLAGATAAEKGGFDGMWTSDHIQPWQENEGHAMFPWITLALLGAQTHNAFFGTGVTTPMYGSQVLPQLTG